MPDQLLQVVSSYGCMRRDVFLECMCDLAGRSRKEWLENDQRFGGLITERAMDALGHIDVSFDDRPPMVYAGPRLLVLQQTATAIPIALLVGNRSEETLDQLHTAVERIDVLLDVSEPYPGYPCLPSRVKVTVEEIEQLESLASTIGAKFVRFPPANGFLDFSFSLQEYLKTLVYTDEGDLNWVTRRYDVSRLSFGQSVARSDLVLIEFRDPHSSFPLYRLRRGSQTCTVSRDWGRYAVLHAAGRQVIGFQKYGPQASLGKMIVPVGAPLPRLLSRAVCLCSGHAPLYRSRANVTMQTPEWRGFYVFDGVPVDFACRVAERLGQTLQPASAKGSGDGDA